MVLDAGGGRSHRKGEFGSLSHLAVRFLTALWPGGPPKSSELWALEMLLPGEQRLWWQMSGPDRRHGIAVARRTVRALEGNGTEVPREVVAAALLHDIGKVEARLGTFARVGVTLLAMMAGRQRLVGERGDKEVAHGLRERVRLYLAHDKVGARLLRLAGSHEVTAEWALEHHLPPEAWTIDPNVAHALKSADGD